MRETVETVDAKVTPPGTPLKRGVNESGLLGLAQQCEISGLTLLAAALALTSCSQPKAAPPPTPKVTVSQPQTATVTNWDEYPGHLQAVEWVEIRPRVSGYIDSIHFQEGAEVKAGNLLVVIDPKPYQAELDRAQAQRQQAETHLELAQNDLKRVESLRGTKAISEEEYDSRSKAVREAEAALAAAKANEAMARINLEYTQIKSPINGRIGRRLVTAGNFVQLQGNGGAATVLATIVSLDPVYCHFDAQEQAYLQYRKNGNTGGALPCQLALVNEEGFPHQGHVDFFDNQVDSRTGTIRMRASFENHDRALVPGLFANVRVPAGPPVQALLIPDVAVGSDQGRKFVYVVNAESKIETRSITTGRRHGLLRAVLAGLTPEERVVVNGLMMVRPGAKVEVQSPESNPQSAKP
ncbi:MAG: efflux RND transporter periplasmic adaptor subunit [Verrucomicrobia bacterium]|nr:efflux RND transporter periplasmic adaptor subunit [Verrucomicrobiota bacterium]